MKALEEMEEISDEDDAPEDEEEENVARDGKSSVPEPKLKSGSRSESTKRSVPQQRMDVSQLNSTYWMKAKFDVIKFDPNKKFLSKKVRTWELDFFNSLFSNMSRKGKVKKAMKTGKLIQLEKNHTDLKRLRMQFFGANHPYQLQFSSNFLRERFYEAASALRPTQYIWSPSLCIPGEGKSKTELYGSFNYNDKGTKTLIEGACKD